MIKCLLRMQKVPDSVLGISSSKDPEAGDKYLYNIYTNITNTLILLPKPLEQPAAGRTDLQIMC